jgi:hypothetical protein
MLERRAKVAANADDHELILIPEEVTGPHLALWPEQKADRPEIPPGARNYMEEVGSIHNELIKTPQEQHRIISCDLTDWTAIINAKL